MTIAFLLTSLIVVASPGTGVLYTLAAGLKHGPRTSLVAAFGCTLGIVPHMAAAITGLAAVLHASAVAFHGLKYLGVAYLLWMAWRTLRDERPLEVESKTGGYSTWQIVATAILINILNPKLSVFFLAFLPQFIAMDEVHPIAAMLKLSGVFMLMTFVVFGFYGVFAGLVRARVMARPRMIAWMRRTFAVAFVALGAKLALAER